MKANDIMPASGLSRIVDGLMEAVACGLRSLRRGGAHWNAPASMSLALLNRLALILRCAFVILALHIQVKPLRPRPEQAWRPRVRPFRRAGFQLFARPFRLRDADAAKRPLPPSLARAVRDPYQAVLRKSEALARALSNPLPLLRRMARRLPTQLMVFGWRPPRRPPRRHRDAYEYLLEGWREARFALGEWRRRRRDNGEDTSASGGCGERKACVRASVRSLA